MTEYDYSPAAYERYMDNQNRVSNWVHKQSSYAPVYANPFKPPVDYLPAHEPEPESPSHSSSRHRDRDYDRSDRESSSRHSHSGSRPNVYRSATTPIPPSSSTQYQNKHSRSPSRSRDYSTSRHNNHHRSASSSTPITYIPAAPPLPPPHGYSGYDNNGQKTMYKTYTYDASTGREIVLPPMRSGETYVICPPTGHRVEVIQDSSTGSRSSSQSPTKKNNPPLLKRIFGLGNQSESKSRGDGHHREGSRLTRSRSERRDYRSSY